MWADSKVSSNQFIYKSNHVTIYPIFSILAFEFEIQACLYISLAVYNLLIKFEILCIEIKKEKKDNPKKFTIGKREL